MVGDDFDLPGVPFDSYFWGSVAIHGTYWHNDYGRPRSHGCVNVPSEAAKWIFRWTTPVVPYEEYGLRVQEGGTLVVVY
jgi:lipoprotein-anchoring transpeptidase ErfK/SrfK